MAEPRLSDEDVERIAEAVVARLRREPAANIEPQPEEPVVVTERHLRYAAEMLSKKKTIRRRR
ncbi:MAG TPA: hypothetical protein VM513_15230 [Kofleriaceae bacterium]|nr:hypothetical protein [Kofleriaceae bacterium]